MSATQAQIDQVTEALHAMKRAPREVIGKLTAKQRAVILTDWLVTDCKLSAEDMADLSNRLARAADEMERRNKEN